MEVWPFMPQVGITESLEWLTDVIACRGQEYRAALRATPRQELQMRFILNATSYSRAKALAKLLSGDEFYVPNWPSLSEVTAIDPGNVIVTSTYAKGFLEDDKALLWESDTSFQVLTVASVSSTGVTVDETLASNSTSAWGAGTVISVGTGPFSVAVTPDGTKALVVNYGGSNVTPLALSGGVWIPGTAISVGSSPLIVAISPNGLNALVVNFSSNNVTPLTLVGSTWTAGTPISVDTGPRGVAISSDGVTALVACSGTSTVVPLTLSGGSWTAGTPIGVGSIPFSIAISSEGSKALTANYGNNTVTPLTLSGGTWTAGTDISVGSSPRGVAISYDGTKALVANSNGGNVTPLTLSGGTWTAGATIAVGTTPISVAISGTRALVCNSGSSNVTPLTISGSIWAPETPISVGSTPSGVAFTPSGTSALIATYGTSNVTPLEYTTTVTSIVDAVLIPLRVATFAQDFSTERSTFPVAECSGRFLTTATEDWSALSGISYPTYLTYPVVTDRCFLSGQQTEDFFREVESLDSLSGSLWREPMKNIPTQKTVWAWSSLSLSETWDIRIWLHQRKGRQKAFWIPSWSSDVQITTDIASHHTTLTITDMDYTTLNAGTSYLMIAETSGTLHFVKVTDANPSTGGTEVLTLSAATGFNLTVANISQVCYLVLSRFDADRIEIQHGKGGSAVISCPVVEVPIP